jgi:hypothetical protein
MSRAGKWTQLALTILRRRRPCLPPPANRPSTDPTT